MLQPVFAPFPVIHTARLNLRQPTTADAQDLLAMRSDPEVMRYIPRPLATGIKDVHELLWQLDEGTQRGERINWAIEWRETGAVIGMIGYVQIKNAHDRAEVGYSLNRDWHRRGIMLEALRAVIAWGFETLGLHSVEAVIDAENEASGNLLQKAGFRVEAHFLEDFFWNGQYRNSTHFGMLRQEWNGQMTFSK